jgi:hypothetical protein
MRPARRAGQILAHPQEQNRGNRRELAAMTSGVQPKTGFDPFFPPFPLSMVGSKSKLPTAEILPVAGYRWRRTQDSLSKG